MLIIISAPLKGPPGSTQTKAFKKILDTLLLFDGKMLGIVFSLRLRVKFTIVDVLTLCFSEKLPAAGNLTFIFRG